MIKKIILCVISVILICFGLANAYMNIVFAPSEVLKIQKPISTSGTEYIAMDSQENIYLGNPQNGSIQMFGRTGNFLSGYILPTAGGHFLMCIYNDTVYVYMFRTSMEYNIKDGVLINTKQTSEDEFEEFYDSNKSDIKNSRKIKFFAISRKIQIENKEIYLDAPIFPLAMSDSISLFGFGIIILFCCFADKFLDICHEISIGNKKRRLK